MKAWKAVLYGLIVLCILAMLFVICVVGFFLVMGTMALSAGPVPSFYVLRAAFFVGALVSAILLWKWPEIALAVAWLDFVSMAVLFLRPPVNIENIYLRYFTSDIVFFLAAHVGFGARLMLNRITKVKG